jgi:hypothetical protein
VTAPATARLADLVAAKQDALPSVSSAGSVVSKASSSKRVEHVEQQILEERRANSTISTHIREATLQLDRLEKLLSRREKPFTHN